MEEKVGGKYVVIGPDEGKSYWQPKPANGYVRTLLNSEVTGAGTPFCAGTQTIDPGCFVREHCHDAHEEIIYIFEGEGVAQLEGKEIALAPGACLFLGKHRKHRFINTGTGPLSFFWTLMPGGLDDFFRQIGRERTAGAIPPVPFERPADIAAIEASTVFGWTQKS
ncbi:cupin domain-containing protein [Kerstersia similis]|uniref:cupin domain-containing protein n=1 Tax=Kerstersia similis TaxID=206505 RepID=UPI0039F03039